MDTQGDKTRNAFNDEYFSGEFSEFHKSKNKTDTNEKFDALVFIGRFQPWHHGHSVIVDEALKQAKEVIVVVGSSFAARNIRNPFTFEERRAMIKAVFPQDNVKVVPVSDYPYDDSKWIAAVQNVVHGAISWSADPIRIGLIGHEKDGTSYYLKIFPTWGSVSVPNVAGINATDIRKMMYGERSSEGNAYMPYEAYNQLCKTIIRIGQPGGQWDTLLAEYNMIKKYKESWKTAPFSPTFVTVDAVVVQSGHILLVKRGAMPGKGLWALPGGFLNQDETMLDGAIRELKEETKIKVPVPVLKGSIKESKTFDAPNRSQRGRTITQAFYIDLGFDEKLPKVKGSDDAEKAFWVPLHEVVKHRDCFFEDHFAIISFFTKVG
jgi:bifunctional NMN adenylyltransferase/nudix hydrolase